MKIGVVGTGMIVPEFLRVAKQLDKAEISAIYGLPRNEQVLQQLCDAYSIARYFTDYDAFLQSDIDTVYVAVPNHLHYEMTKAAILAGRHVLLEKPFTSNFAQAQELFRLAEKHGTLLFEAIPNIYTPAYAQTPAQLSKLGNIKLVSMNYSQYSSRYDAFKRGIVKPVFDPQQAGGALMDLGVYNVHFVLGLFGEPLSLHYTANIEGGIDVSGVLTMKYPTFTATLTAAKDCKAPCHITLQGDSAYLHSTCPANEYRDFSVVANDGSRLALQSRDEQHRLYHELNYLIDAVKRSDRAAMERARRQTLAVMKVLDEARRQVGLPTLEQRAD